MRFKILLFSTMLAMFFSGCSITSAPKPDSGEFSKEAFKYNERKIFYEIDRDILEIGFKNIEIHEKLLRSIDKYIGTRKGGDCSGFISVLNDENSHIFFDNDELNDHFSNRQKSQAMFNYYQEKKRIKMDDPSIGDLIFFQNTTTKTKKKINGQITHVGVVRDIYKDGRIKFVHFASGKNMVDYMNLKKPNVNKEGKKIENSYVARCGKKNISCLAANRFAGFGKISR